MNENSARPPSRVAWAALAGCSTLLLLVAACAEPSTLRDDAWLAPTSEAINTLQEDPHGELFLKDRFPSAQSCRTCHPEHYRQWSVSPHAYAQLSPVFNAMHGKILKLMNGTTGDFCIRCHTPVGMTIGEPLFTSNLNRHPTSREGVTCIACHRVNTAHGKDNGRRAIVQAPLVQPIYGPTGGSEVKRVMESPEYRVTAEPGTPGRKIHGDVEKFWQLVEPAFCGACHDVTLPNGFRLEEAFSEYKTSPAAKRGESCQDCHMGKELGKASGFHTGPAAIVGDKPTRTRKLTNHMFMGPDYSIVHPGIFPHNPDAQALATMAEWLLFDHKAGWGTDAFEDEVADDHPFPKPWDSADDRYDAREILDAQFALLKEASDKRYELLRNGYQIESVSADKTSRDGIGFSVVVKNATDGHNVPTGFTAERLVWLEVTVTDPAGNVVMRSGDLDPNGDVRDAHSVYVHNGDLPKDAQLFSLQSKFITRQIRGGEREQVLAVNQSLDPLPFLRPEAFSSVLTGRPSDARIHKLSIPPLGTRTARYTVHPKKVAGPGDYRASIRLKAAMVPVNLVHEIHDVGFDYGMSARQVAAAIVEGHLTLGERELTLTVE
ncbi:MAG: cytochrome C [Planctomycetes bacterium]|nr:cytochrome C [Planctomycetota bacterium]